MAGGELRRTEAIGERDHRVDPQLAVAEHAGVRGPPLGVPLDEGGDDAGAELVLEVEGQMRDAERMGDAASGEHRLGRAAAPLPVRPLIRPELQRHGDHSRPASPSRRAATAESTPPLSATRTRSPSPGAEASGAPEPARRERPVERIGREHRGVPVRRGEAAEFGLDALRRDPGGIEDGGATDQLGRGGGCRGGRRAALGVEGHPLDPTLTGDQRDPREIAARRSTGRAAVCALRRGAPTRVVGEVLLECFPIHGEKLRRLQPAVSAPAW